MSLTEEQKEQIVAGLEAEFAAAKVAGRERPPFESFPSIVRLRRPVAITEKIDGTNAQVLITEWGDVFAGSRSRWITPEDDNFGFARWVEGNRQDILRLGPGRHFGEYWGAGIQRTYGLKEKRWSLFNVSRWGDPASRPECVGCVPELARLAEFDTQAIGAVMEKLRTEGSVAAPGFMRPEGIVCFHVVSQALFKWTFDDDEGKTVAAEKAARTGKPVLPKCSLCTHPEVAHKPTCGCGCAGFVA